MKNIINSPNSVVNSTNSSIIINKEHLENTLEYFNNLIQKTLLSIQRYKMLDIIGVNELNICTDELSDLVKICIDIYNHQVI